MSDRPVFVFGDVHGRLDLLTALITKVRDYFGPEVDLYSVGDLVDRGPDSRGVIELCINEGVQAILGNHETWLHQYLATGQFDSFALHKMMGGIETLQSYGLKSLSPGDIERDLKHLIPPHHRKFILGLPLWRRIETAGRVFFLNHAAVKRDTYQGAVHEIGTYGQPPPPDEEVMAFIAKYSPASILWTTNSFQNPSFHHFATATQVFGHTPTPDGNPIVTKPWIAVDSGCGVRRAVLSGVVLGTGKVFQVNALTSTLEGGDGFKDFSM